MHHGAELPVVQPEATLEQVLVEMTRKCLGLAIIVEKDQVLGVITDGDLRRLFQTGKFRKEAKAHEILTPNPRKILETSLALEAREIMEKNAIHQLLVVDAQDKLVGVVHIHDLMRRKVM